MRKQLGILGCGTIGSEIAGAIADGTVSGNLAAAYDRNVERAVDIADQFDPDGRPLVTESVDELAHEADLVVETAGQHAVKEFAIPLLEAECDLLLLSVGALADEQLRRAIVDTATQTDRTVHVPSGAIAGLDAIKGAALSGDLESVSLTTRKNPRGLKGAPYFESASVNLGGLTEPQVVFQGTAAEAASAFPSNINVAMSLSLAGIGADETTVTIIADPAEENNIHHIEATGKMGYIETTVQNRPSPTNPKTSYLAALSAIETLRGLNTTVRVGT
jgi:aspartate dehydrogenase